MTESLPALGYEHLGNGVGTGRTRTPEDSGTCSSMEVVTVPRA